MTLVFVRTFAACVCVVCRGEQIACDMEGREGRCNDANCACGTQEKGGGVSISCGIEVGISKQEITKKMYFYSAQH